ncbi:pullulanase-associated domain-containing protein [Haloplasma contractile]|uniref:Pullanase-associated domain protein n=1 Tax=Haloplasma contractile SSD-17B TaxID=1033810 RepID=U2EDK9_9MOLU|nr:pullulanase-associated domain-containing protein [Haloplasma contractile]ERJ13068.1 pullanase-associated domain protein [Haloplasma contractile SSD-17B]
MKKLLSFLLIMVATIVTFGVSIIDINAEYTEKACDDAKVVVHYKRLDDVYDEVGVWTWGNGDSGSADGVAKSGTDDFGAVIEICVDRSAADSLDDKGAFIPISQNLASDTATWPGDYKDSAGGANIEYDWSSLIDGTVDELHVYFIQGNDGVFVNTDAYSFFNNPTDFARLGRENASLGTITVLYYDPEVRNDETAYDSWTLHTWDTGAEGTAINDSQHSDGLPFQWDYISPDGAEMKVAVINVADDAQDKVGFIVRDPDWNKKYSSDLFIDVTDVKGSGEKVVYYVAGNDHLSYTYDDFMVDYVATLKNVLAPFDAVEGVGTHATSTTTLHIEFQYEAIVDTLADNIVLTDLDSGEEIAMTDLTAVEPVDGKAYVFTANVADELSKDGNYELNYKNGETTVVVDLDNNAPMISYTNKVKLDSTKYDEKNDVYLIEKDSTFNLEDYIRLNIVDDRDGSLIDQLQQTELPDSSIVGNYVLSVSATDSWDNESELLFNFKVFEPAAEEIIEDPVVEEVEEGNFFEDNMALVIGGISIVLITGAAGTMLIKKKY